MLAEILDLLACPHCRGPLDTIGDRVVGCSVGHRFDVARQGYLNLAATTGGHRSDTTAMIAARDRFLRAGHYDKITDAVVESRVAGSATAVLEVGAGTGHYLRAVLDRLPAGRGIALDLSVPAARRAARAHPRIGAVVADVWAGLPVRDACLDLVLAVFAPRNAAEFTRVLRPGGALTVVTAAPEHLYELRAAFGLLTVQQDKTDRLDASLTPTFELQSRRRLETSLRLGPDDLVDLVAMGPNAFHADLDAVRTRADHLGRTDVSASVDISHYRLRPPVD